MLSAWQSPRSTIRAAQPSSQSRRQTVFLILCKAVKSAATGRSNESSKPRKSFKFRYFEVFQDACAMKVGTDAMLLGSWAQPLPGGTSTLPPPGPSGSSPASVQCPGPSASGSVAESGSGSKPAATVRVLDVGTGTGVLALMMAQKLAAAAGAQGTAAGAEAAGAERAAGGASRGGETAAGAAGRQPPPPPPPQQQQPWPQVVAIDVDESAVLQARENVGLSPWADRIRVLHVGLQQLAAAAAALAQPAAPPIHVPAVRPSAEEAEQNQQRQQQQQPPVSHEAPAGRRRAAASVSASGAAASEAHLDLASATAGAATSTAATHTIITAADVGPFDLIITNPPYFVASSKPAQGRDARAAARHADVSLPFPELAAGCAALLAPGGAVCVVLPPPEADSFQAAAARCGLVLTELVQVFTAAEDEQPRRHLMRLQRAADLPSLTASSSPPPEPLVTRLVINGPKRSTTGGGSSSNGAGASRDGSGSEGGSSSEGEDTGAARPGPARPLTGQYRRLTQDYHDPAFLKSSAAAEDDDEKAT